MYLLLIFLPFASSVFVGLLGKRLGPFGASIIATFCLFAALLCSFLIFFEVVLAECSTYLKITVWVNSEILNVNWGLIFDNLTAFMCVVVVFISVLVHFYSTEYMSHDPFLPKFMCYLSLFTFFMLVLITGDNFLQMFVGWEGVGLCSYLLINFWFTRVQANKAAIKAMLINRIGDFSLLIGIFLIFTYYKAVDYATVAALTPFFKHTIINFLNFEVKMLSVICIFLFLGAVGKSAQLGLHSWLPDAMEGPTPVSALIHAATMVTAGVFLVARCSFIFEYCPKILNYVVVLGCVTSVFAATTGLLQNDLKRVIAYSTCSQLGYMIFACGSSNYNVSFFHLTNHAFFKALLFLSAGSIIHAISDEQDMRKMGGLKNLTPLTYSALIVGSLALTGFPFLSGFYSKDLILETAFAKYNCFCSFSYWLGGFGAFLTAFYSMRLVFLTFLSKPTGHKSIICFAQDSGPQISISLGCLIFPSILGGYYLKEIMINPNSSANGLSMLTTVINHNLFEAEFIKLHSKLMPVFLSLLGTGLALIFYVFKPQFLFFLKISSAGKKIYYFLNRKWYGDKIINDYFGQFLFKFGYSISYKFVDRGIFEIFGATGLSNNALKISKNLDKLQSKFIYHYSLIILISVAISFFFKSIFLIFGFHADCRLIIIFLILLFFIRNEKL